MRYGIALVSAAMLCLATAAAVVEAQSTPPKNDASATTAKTPHDCLTAYDADINKGIEAAEKAQQAFDGKAIVGAATANAKQCAAQFDVATIDPTQLSDLGAVYLRASQLALADQAFQRTFAEPGLSDSLRADHMAQAVRAYLGFRSHDSTELAESHATAARYLSTLDAMPHAIVERFGVRRSLLSYYDEHDVDSGIVRVAPEMVALAHQMTPAEITNNADALMRAYVTWSEVWANVLRNDSALTIVQRADHDFPLLTSIHSWSRQSLDHAIARYEMVGKHAPAVHGDYWLNGAAHAVNPGVTIVMFSAHDCPACRLSYPTMAKLVSDYGPRGFHLVMSIDLSGEFDNKPMSPSQEIAANDAFYRQLNLTPPIAFERPGKPDANGDTHPAPHATSVRYNTDGFPYYFVIDSRGVIRAVLIGWDTSGVSERSLRSIITELLGTTATAQR